MCRSVLMGIVLLLSSGLSYAEFKYEFSFGTSQMFIDEVSRQELRGQNRVVMPTTSALFVGERFWGKRWSTIVGYNLPLETQKFLVNGELVEEIAAKTLSIGQAYRLFIVPINNDAVLSLQVAPMMSFLFSQELAITPSLGSRIHLASQSGFAMYLGGIASYGLKGAVLLYGVGHRF